LPRIALGTYQFGEGFAIKVVRFVLVMAKSALVELVAAGGLHK